MFFIENDVIYITRGDYAELAVAITDETGAAYEMQEGDLLTLSVRERPDEASPLMFSVTSPTDTIVINHADTASIAPGEYSADVQLTTADGKIRTVWAKLPPASKRYRTTNWENFVIMPEVTAE